MGFESKMALHSVQTCMFDSSKYEYRSFIAILIFYSKFEIRLTKINTVVISNSFTC